MNAEEGHPTMSNRRRLLKAAAVTGALVCAVAAGAIVSAARSTPAAHAAPPAASTAALNAQYTACLKSNGAKWIPIANSGGFFRVQIPAAANANCSSLDLAREAAADGDAVTAAWLARIGSAPAGFWACVGAAGFHVTGGTGQRSDYSSADFGSTARACAAANGVALPEGP
jgi:hypothetical protein